MNTEQLVQLSTGTAQATTLLTPETVISMQGVWAAYDAQDYALRDISLEVRRGEKRAIVGPSGSGKSTLLKMLKGLVPPVRGELYTLGVRCDGSMARALRARVGYIPQNLGLVTSATVLQNALMGGLHRVGELRSWFGVFPGSEQEAAHAALESVGIGHLAHRRAHELSGGERRRLAVARALVQEPELLLADEFLSELDDDSAEQVLEALENARQRLGLTIVIVEHNLAVACSFSDRLTVLRDGAVVRHCYGCEVNPQELRCLFRASVLH
jgi:phosphonate transport system ATP-binding protein